MTKLENQVTGLNKVITSLFIKIELH